MFPNPQNRHSEWRKLAKKLRRKRIRRSKAQLRDRLFAEERDHREQSPSFLAWQKLENERERFQEEEEVRLQQAKEAEWLRVEVEAQRQWRDLQRRLQAAREERAKQNAKIRLEWEKEEARLKELKERKEKELEAQQVLQEQRDRDLDNFITNGGHTPEHLKINLETNPNKVICPFFHKTSTCRFFDACSRNHMRPGVSKIILITNFYCHYSLEKTSDNEHGGDASLEFEGDEMYNDFKAFFYDVVPEIEKSGKIVYFQVCCNHEPHLRGNVYVEYESTRSAMKSFRTFNGRWYGGKRLNVEFCGFDSWKKAICGLFFSNRCPKGSACNFLHVFRNPGRMYSYDIRVERRANESERREWRWSESPERRAPDKNRGHRKSRRRSRSRSRSRKSRKSCN